MVKRVLSGTMSLVVLVVVLAACTTLRQVSPARDTLVLYNPGKTILHPLFKVYHNSDTESTLFFRVMTSQLVFSQANEQLADRAQLKLIWTLYTSYENYEIAERDTQYFAVYKDRAGLAYTGSQKLETEPNHTYLLDVELIDDIRKVGAREFILVDRFSEIPQQDYLVLEYPGAKPGFNRFYYPDESFRIVHRNVQYDRMYISRYSPRKILPRPPYSVEENTSAIPFPDSTWERVHSEQSLYNLPQPGLYQFRFDRESNKGFCLVNFSDHFPQIEQPADLARPLQYITTRDEYRRLVGEDDLKLAIDEFWLEKGKTFPYARDLIRIFYNRVLFANYYFTSTKEGWMTDRGMIYVIIGPPEEVRRTDSQETWIYRELDSDRNYSFDFVLTPDHWIGYDFVLRRTEDHRGIWNTAVESWRQGKIFSLQ